MNKTINIFLAVFIALTMVDAKEDLEKIVGELKMKIEGMEKHQALTEERIILI